MNVMLCGMDQFIPCQLMDPARYSFSKAPFPAYISYAVFSADTAYTISHCLWLHFLYRCSTVLRTLLPMLLFFINIYLFIFRIYSHYKFIILTWIYDEIFSHFITWKAEDYYLVIAHKFNMFCVGIFLQNEDCKDELPYIQVSTVHHQKWSLLFAYFVILLWYNYFVLSSVHFTFLLLWCHILKMDFIYSDPKHV
jgi:hypothetical protein